MATQVTLKAELRQGRGKGPARRLRAAGQLPAVVYGADEEPLSITLDAHDAIHLFHSVSVENTIINLPSNELSRARGGSHCMTCPVERE